MKAFCDLRVASVALLTHALNGQTGQYDEIPYFDFSNASFQISGQLTNLQSLPFVPTFNAASMAAGQAVDVTSGTLIFGGTAYTPANTITLIPQTINGTVQGSSTTGNFTIYTVAVASYDCFRSLPFSRGKLLRSIIRARSKSTSTAPLRS